MIALNLTLVFQFVLFLLFLWGTNKMIFRPLLKTMDARKAKIEGDRAAAETETREVQELDATYTKRLASAHQASAQRLHQARHDVYQQNRDVLDEQKRRADAEVAAERAAMDAPSGHCRGDGPASRRGGESAVKSARTHDMASDGVLA
ncbi:MAG: ATP synthase F0 subunit B [Candidatus Hydrogenedentes bacterium]|nr:ATP synthase F0 subunit B [Candidatus Hydrogenedentota bacterium]